MTEYIKCGRCKHLFKDYSVGYSECTKEDLMTDLEFAEYEEFGGVLHCPYFEGDPSDLIDPYTEEDEYYDVSTTRSVVNSDDTLIRAAQKDSESDDSLKQLYADYIHEEESYQPWADDPGMDWPDENWPTISEYEIHKNEENIK